MNIYCSGFSQKVEVFVSYRKASGTWNEHAIAQNLKYFDRYCANNYPDSSSLTQDMVDTWCSQCTTESSSSCYIRTLIVRGFIDYLHRRGITDAVSPKAPKLEKRKYVPHAFTDEELARFFEECDSIIPYKGRPASVLRKIQCPAFFRLLYSSGMRTTEARFLKRDDVDLDHGVVNIHKSKGYDQHYVALHDTMTEFLRRYDEAVDRIQPKRTYFFESLKGTCYGREWVNDNFKKIWEAANGSSNGMIPYDVSHPNLNKIQTFQKKCRDCNKCNLKRFGFYLSLDLFRRTRATNLYQDGVEFELVSRILGHSSTQTTRIYATPSIEMMKAAMEHKSDSPSKEKELWLDDEEELARLCGIR